MRQLRAGEAAAVSLSLFHLPRRHAHLARQLVSAHAHVVHAGNIADTHGERAEHRNRLRAGGQCVAEQAQGLGSVTRDGGTR